MAQVPEWNSGEPTSRSKATEFKKVWHRGGWNSRFHRGEIHRQRRGPAVYEVEAARPSAAAAPPCAAGFARRHTHTHTFQQGMSHTHATLLVRTDAAGTRRGPEVHGNYAAFCGELGQQVSSIERTLGSLRDRCLKLKEGQLCGLPADGAARLRAAVGDSAAEQMAFYHRCMELWTGMDREAQQRYVGAMTTAMERWRSWTAPERETFLDLLSRSAQETASDARAVAPCGA
mmetsp:Transcript_18346/g.43875  ORF Transcript_18346/g.43875 Transcript_18346/m.43875 type:complete len:231 (+) Transcript_18346:173-865(+)|eukprot:CAMPEP_0177601978 /NCGR_PEP_ID=MMETSP0419_2-20121207/14598_1 /TAXON_ID=582737 /ORGANISM="Tetraselmis sp., Strain GSL018" /LENGTH=230 /DNA_ID=CAMNT_0019095381 /DNA_START=287 /DNA_END=979 /DNA_ORIENTATION=+